MPLVAFISAVLGVTAIHAATSTACGSPDWATPLNTALLIGLATIQHRHYRRTGTVQRIVDRTLGRRRQEVPPPDREWKRGGDPPSEVGP